MLEFSIKIKLRDARDAPDTINFSLPIFNLRTCLISDIDKPETDYYFNQSQRNQLAELKNKIDQNDASKDWDKSKKISNVYELIHISNNKMKAESISRYDPLSRSFFKLWEIVNYFGLITTRNPIVTGHLAEGPGGFVEACLYYRQRLIKVFPLLDKYYGITLNPTTKEIPGWNKANNLLRQFKKNIEIDYGTDNTGNLYKIANIRSFSRKIKSIVAGADLITADGGFDFSVNFNKQEQMSHRLIISELLTGIKSQKLKGSMICKLFDSYSYITVQLLYFISCLYEEVHLVKPLTSRPANSEKYLVAISYKGFSSNLEEQYYIGQLEMLLNKWDNVCKPNPNELIYKSIFENPPQEFFQRVQSYNEQSFIQQSIYIDKTIELIKHKPSWKELEIIINNQTEKAIEWCEQYHLSINLESYFYQKYRFTKENENRNLTENENIKYKDYLDGLDDYFRNFIGY